MKSQLTKFAVGTEVEWRSQAQGSCKTKRGTIIEVIPASKRPDTQIYPHLLGAGWGRKHESYVVLVGRRHYWPVVSKLQKVGE